MIRGHVSKQGSRLLRWALVEAIQHQPAGTRLRAAREAILAHRVFSRSLVFTTTIGAMFDQHNSRRGFRQITRAAGLGDEWVPRELRHTFVSIMSAGGVSVEEIARLAGHQQTSTTELVNRRELRPVITTGAEIMDRIFSS
jgi:site-specific recombinase XerD